MSDETPRLKLPQLVSLQEANTVTWNEALAQIDALVDLCLLGQFVTTPPVSPADGDAYLLGAAPSGVWNGYAYKIAVCLDGGWRFYTPFNGLRAYVATTASLIIYLNGVWSDWNALISAREVSLASDSICDLGAANALFVVITGTTAIAGFGASVNTLRYVRFAQTLTLTHNPTSLILLGGVSRSTAAGDVGVYASDSNGNWRERAYFRAAQSPIEINGSYTPTLHGRTSDCAVTYAGQEGLYRRLGRLVHVEVYISLSAITAQGSGQLYVTLPFAPASSSAAGSLALSQGFATNQPLFARSFQPVNGAVLLYRAAVNTQSFVMDISEITAATTFRFQLDYLTNDP